MAADTIGYSDKYDFHYESRRGGRLELSERSRFAVVIAEFGGGELAVRGKHYRFSASDVLILPEGKGYTLDLGEAGCAALVLFRPYFLSEDLRSALKSAPITVRPVDGGREVTELSSRLAQEMKRNDRLSHDLCRAYTAQLCVALARSAEAASEPTEIYPATETALKYVSEHSAERISLADMAAMCKVSTAYLSRKFKTEVGIGFADYVARFRLERAEAMLREKPELSVTEIAFLCGFNDSNYFSDKFKKHFGISPLKFRKKHLKSEFLPQK